MMQRIVDVSMVTHCNQGTVCLCRLVDPAARRTVGSWSPVPQLHVGRQDMAASPMKERKRCSVADWESSNRQISENAELRRLAAHRIQQQARHLRNDTLSKMELDQSNSFQHLTDKIQEVSHWKDRLQSCLQEVDEEIDILRKVKEEAERVLSALLLPQEVSMECLSLREGRQGGELVCDPVEAELKKEVEASDKAKQELQQHVDKAFQQLMSTSPQEWEQFSRCNVSRAKEEVETSEQLREDVTLTLVKVLSELQAQHAATSFALRKRYHQVDQACSELRWQQKTTREEIAELELDICRLEEDLQAKEAPLKLVHTRLENRAMRPGVDLCQDQVQHGLVSECKQLEVTIMSLKQKLSQAQHSLQMLQQQQTCMDKDLSCKLYALSLEQRTLETRKHLQKQTQTAQGSTTVPLVKFKKSYGLHSVPFSQSQ